MTDESKSETTFLTPLLLATVPLYLLLIFILIFTTREISLGNFFDLGIPIILGICASITPPIATYKLMSKCDNKQKLINCSVISFISLILATTLLFTVIFPNFTTPVQEKSHNRHIVFVHGSVLDDEGLRERIGLKHFEEIKNYLLDAFDIYEKNHHSPDWIGENNANVRELGGRIVAYTLQEIFKTNPDAEILIIGYSHGGNVAKSALNYLDTYEETNFNNITLINTATPALTTYQLNEAVQKNLNHHFNFYNNHDMTQNRYAAIGSSGGLFHEGDFIQLENHERGRAQPGATNINVSIGVPTGVIDNWLGMAAHTIMITNIEIWDHYKIPLILDVLPIEITNID